MKQVLGIALSAILFGGCNVFSSIDSPAGDAQLLSAARACFDRGDYSCASDLYSKVSSASSDLANSEKAFLLLAQNGMTVGVLMNAVISGGSNGGVLITKMANSLTRVASETTRLGIFHAYQMTSSITERHTQGLVRFISAAALLAEILAENAAVQGTLAKTDLVTNATTCLASKDTGFNSTGCYAPSRSGYTLTTGTTLSLRTATDTTMSGDPTLNMVNAAVSEVSSGISQMETNGSLGAATSSFTRSILDAAAALTGGTGDSPAYRGALLQFNLGE